MLRAVISPEGRNRILERVPHYRVRVHDLTAATAPDRERKLDRIRERMVRREPRPGRWPLVDIRAARLPDGVVRLYVNVDVLVCDTASYLIWDRELRALYTDPAAELPPLTTTFAACVAALERRAEGPEHARAAAYWRARLDSLPGAPALPLRPSGTEARPRFGRRTARLEPARWAALKAEAAQRGLTPPPYSSPRTGRRWRAGRDRTASRSRSPSSTAPPNSRARTPSWVTSPRSWRTPWTARRTRPSPRRRPAPNARSSRTWTTARSPRWRCSRRSPRAAGAPSRCPSSSPARSACRGRSAAATTSTGPGPRCTG
ncbi:hypothetical protein NKH77_04400 [Streptomyces sp. M19]